MSKRTQISGCTYLVVFTILMIILVGIATTSTTYAAADTSASNGGDITVTIDGKPLGLEVPPTIIGGRTLVPLRAIFEAMGAKVDWNPATKTITGIKDNTKITLKVNSKLAYVNDSTVRIDVPATVINGRTLVPARFIAESLGTDVEWVRDSKTVVIASPKVVAFPDPNLEAAVRTSLKKNEGDILRSDLKKITYLIANDKGISNLEGIQYMVNLRGLILANNKISDVSLLSANINLEQLMLSKNFISDISPLKALNKLTNLNLYSNQITDISVAANFPNLKELDVNTNQVYDISPLKTLKNLGKLDLASNPIIDISALNSLSNLKELNILHFTKNDEVNDDLFSKFDMMKNKVNEIISSIIKPEMSQLDKELAIHDYIVSHTRYDNENFIKNTIPDEGHMQYGALINGVAVCDGYARAFQVLLNAVGIESVVINGGEFDSLYGSLEDEQVNNTGENKIDWKHAWNIVKIDNNYFQVDVTSDDPVTKDGTSVLSHLYFNISDSQMSVDHEWEKAYYADCLVDSGTYHTWMKDYMDAIIADNYYYIDKSKKIYKKSLDGSSKVKLCDDNALDIALGGEWIFYINESDGSKLYKVKTDGTGRTKLRDEKVWDFALYNDVLYYLADDRINRINSDGTGWMQINSDDVSSWFVIEDGWIYLKAFNWSSSIPQLYKMGLNGGDRMLLCGDVPAGYEFSPDGSVNYYYADQEHKIGDWLYFVNKSDGKKIYKVKTDGSLKMLVGSDEADENNVEFVDKYIYYKNMSEGGKYYRVCNDGTGRQPLE